MGSPLVGYAYKPYQKEGFKPPLKCGEHVGLSDPNWKKVTQQRSLITEGSASLSTFGDSMNHKKDCIQGMQFSTGVVGYYELFKIRWCLIFKSFVGEGGGF